MRKACCDKEDTKRGAWTEQEDQRLAHYIQAHGEGCWSTLPRAAGLHRCGNSCRLRWINYLKPDIKGGNFAQDEEDLIIRLHSLLGNRWSLIAGRLPGRTDNEVKNYWKSHISRKLMSMGIDPNNHRLSQNLPRPPNQCVFPSSMLLESKKDTSKPFKISDDDRMSDAASYNEDDHATCSQDHFNLELTIAVPSLSSVVGEKRKAIELAMT